jgi:hypothetical protein
MTAICVIASVTLFVPAVTAKHVSDTMLMVLPAFVLSGLIYEGGQGSFGREKWPMPLLAAYVVSSWIAEIIYLFYRTVKGQEIGDFSICDVLWLCGDLCLCATFVFLTIVKDNGRPSRRNLLLFFVAVFCCVVAAAFVEATLVGVIRTEHQGELPLLGIVLLVYLLADALILTLAGYALIAWRVSKLTMGWKLIAVAAVLNATADILFVHYWLFKYVQNAVDSTGVVYNALYIAHWLTLIVAIAAARVESGHSIPWRIIYVVTRLRAGLDRARIGPAGAILFIAVFVILEKGIEEAVIHSEFLHGRLKEGNETLIASSVLALCLQFFFFKRVERWVEHRVEYEKAFYRDFKDNGWSYELARLGPLRKLYGINDTDAARSEAMVFDRVDRELDVEEARRALKASNWHEEGPKRARDLKARASKSESDAKDTETPGGKDE